MQIKEYMLDYVNNLLEDANDFSWASAKASHAILLCQLEQGEVVSWSDVQKIDRIRRAHAQRHISQQSTQGKTHEKTGLCHVYTVPSPNQGNNTGRVIVFIIQ